MAANEEKQALSDDDLQALLDIFMDADEEESQHMLDEQGGTLLSDHALQLIRAQISELSTIILPTLEKKLQFLEEAKRLRAATASSHPKHDAQQFSSTLQDLLATLGSRSDSGSLTLDDLRMGSTTILQHAPPELMAQLFQQSISSPQEITNLFANALKIQNMPDDSIKQVTDGFYASAHKLRSVDPGFLNYVLQKIWALSPEQRASFWRRDQPPETLLDFTDIQSYIQQHNLDISTMMNPQPLPAPPEQPETNVQPTPASTSLPPETQVRHEQRPAASTEQPDAQRNTPSTSTTLPNIQDKKAFFMSIVQEMQQVFLSGGTYIPSIPPELVDSIDTTDEPRLKQAQLLYRVLYMLARSEGGRNAAQLSSMLTLLEEVMKTDTQTVNPNIQYMYGILHQLLSTDSENSEKVFQQTIREVAASSSSQDENVDPFMRGNALVLSITKNALSNKPEDMEQAIKDCGEVIEIFSQEHMASVRAWAYMARGAVYMALQKHRKQRMIQPTLADFKQALTFFTKETAPDNWAEIHVNLSSLYRMSNTGDPVQNYQMALDSAQAALSVLSPEKTPLRWATAHRSCGNAYSSLFTMQRKKNAEKAQEHYTKALTVLKPENAPSEWAETLIARGRLTRLMTSFSFGEQRELRPHFFGRENLWGTFENMVASLDDAVADFTRVLDVITKQSDPYNWADAHSERAFTRAVLAQNDRKQHLKMVLEDYSAALEIFTYEAYPNEWAETQLQIAITLQRYTAENQEQDSLRALKHIDAALTFYTREGSPLNYHRAQEIRAVMYERLGHWEEARAALMAARAVQRDLLTTTTDSTHLLPIIAEFTRPEIALRHAQIALRLNPPDYEGAVIALEEERAQTMRRLSTRLALDEQPQTLSPLPTPQLADIASCMTEGHMALVYLAAGTNIPLEPSADIGDRLFLGMEEGLALILTKDTAGATHIEHLPLPRLTNLALSFLLEPVFEDKGSDHDKSKDLRIPIKLEHAVAKLGEMGLNELAQTLHGKGIDQITVVLHSSLGLFPLHAAQVTLGDGETHYLGELFEVNIVPSAYAAAQARQRALVAQTVPQALKTVLSAGNPKPADPENYLPFAQQEAQRIHDIAAEHGYQTHYLQPTEITKAYVLQVLQHKESDHTGYMYAHLAVHGDYYPADLRNSRLILAGVNLPVKRHCILLGEVLDGTVDLSNIRLLILSACQTSVIDIQHIPNEAVGLAPAFLQAGAVGVIASLWKVDDLPTYLLMTHFAQLYLSAHGTLSPAQALVMAQRWLREEATYQTIVTLNLLPQAADLSNQLKWELRRFKEQAKVTSGDRPFNHPRYWAAFTVTGY